MATAEDRARHVAGMWSRLTVPVRPSAEGLAVYRQALEGLARKRVLVLGATPELVDLTLEVGAETVVSVERFPEVAEGMRRVATRDWSSVALVSGDWLEESPAYHAAFDCVMCDGGPLFLSFPAQWQRVFGLAHSYLAPGGCLVVKTWAVPAGNLDYNAVTSRLMSAYEREDEGRSSDDARVAYVRLASELRVAVFVGATLDDGSFSQSLIVERCDRLARELEIRYPDPELVEITRAAFVHLARSRPGTTDTVSGVGFDRAAALLERAGFAAEHVPLADPPIPGANYMFVARTKSPG